jgi:phosphatidyl-myo-inositol dimannoside synthase
VRLKIAIFTSEFAPYPGGIATYTYELASAAKELGHDPVVFAPKIADGNDVAATFTVVRNQPRQYKHIDIPIMTIRSALNLLQWKPDVVIAADLPNILALSPIPVSGRKLAVVHGTDVKSKLIGFLNKYSLYRPFNAFEAIYSNSQFTKNIMLRHNPSVSAENIHVAPLGVDQFWRAEFSRQECESLLGRFSLLPDRFLMLSVGRIEPRKGVTQAIEAISRLPADLRNRLTYLIVGRTVENDHAERLAEMISRSNTDIRMVGVVSKEELRALYHAADLLLHTATADRFRAEGFGLVLVEAAACGLPALATRIDAIPEVIRENASGLLVDDGDVDAIAREIGKLMVNPGLLCELASNCKAHAALFTWRRCAQMIIDDGHLAPNATFDPVTGFPDRPANTRS